MSIRVFGIFLFSFVSMFCCAMGNKKKNVQGIKKQNNNVVIKRSVRMGTYGRHHNKPEQYNVQVPIFEFRVGDSSSADSITTVQKKVRKENGPRLDCRKNVEDNEVNNNQISAPSQNSNVLSDATMGNNFYTTIVSDSVPDQDHSVVQGPAYPAQSFSQLQNCPTPQNILPMYPYSGHYSNLPQLYFVPVSYQQTPHFEQQSTAAPDSSLDLDNRRTTWFNYFNNFFNGEYTLEPKNK